VAAFALVDCAVRDVVAPQVALVTTAVDTELGGQSYSASKEEKHVESVEYHRNGGMDDKGLSESNQEEVEEAQHGEDGDKNDIVDGGWIACDRIGDDVTGKRQDEQSP